MKIKYIESNHFIIYLMKYFVKNINFNDKYEVEKYFKLLFKRLNLYYDIDMKGYYNIKIYIDKYYGIVLDIQREEIDCYNYFDNTVDMCITKYETDFMYEIIDFYIIQGIINKVEIYKYKNELYVQLKKELKESDMMKLLENSKIIYSPKKEIYTCLDVDKIN